MFRTFYKIGFLEQLKIQFFRVRTLIEYCIFCAFSIILKRLRRGIGIDRRILDDSPDQARRTKMTTMTMTIIMTKMKMTTRTTTISRRRKPKPSKRRGGSGWGEGARPEGAARRRPLRSRTTAAAITKMSKAAAA